MTEPSQPRRAARLSYFLLLLLPAAMPMLAPVLRGQMHNATSWAAHLFGVGLLVGVYLLNARVALPRLLLRGRAGAYALVVLALMLGMLASCQLLATTFQRELTPPGPPGRPRPPQMMPFVKLPPQGNPQGPATWRLHDSAFILLLSVSVIIGAGVLRATNQRLLAEAEQRRVAEREKLEVELAYLRTQLNPHVFFNTLNSIYVLTDVDVDQSRQAILRLSRLMRYLLAQTHETQVQLTQEVEFLTDYVKLMQLRLTPNMQVQFERPKQLRNGLLTTMLLQPFVENAFKYGVSTSQPATIFIGLQQSADDGTLAFEVRNQVFPVPQSGFAVGSGIGLRNTRRRLELLYPGRHSLRVVERNDAGEFCIHLTLPLT
ncbi:sensor histidine kinase [Hymenobacter gummosus]|nr:histidine kinase [Hymenobacter gummosus]